MVKKRLLLLTPIFMIVFIVVSYIIIFSNLENVGIDRGNIRNTFFKNRASFEDVVIELIGENDVYYSEGYVFISNGEKNEKIYPSDKEIEKYQKTCHLKEELDLEKIVKSGKNIGFYFKGNLRKMAWIVYLMDEDDWINSGHSILYKKQLEGNWYYVESN